MPTENDDPAKSVPLALQRLFYELQHRFVDYYCTSINLVWAMLHVVTAPTLTWFGP